MASGAVLRLTFCTGALMGTAQVPGPKGLISPTYSTQHRLSSPFFFILKKQALLYTEEETFWYPNFSNNFNDFPFLLWRSQFTSMNYQPLFSGQEEQLRKAALPVQSLYLFSCRRATNTVQYNTSKCPDLCSVT